MNIGTRLAMRWHHVHADWWQDDRGNDIHRVDIDDDALYHCHLAGSTLPWDAVAGSLAEAMAVVDGTAPGPTVPEDVVSRPRGTPLLDPQRR